MKHNISVALPKGRLAEDTIDLFVKKGICRAGVVDFDSRKLVFEDEESDIKFLLVRNMDVPVYVEHGACDFGIVGYDIIAEKRPDIYEFADLGFGYCRLCAAGIKGSDHAYCQDMKIATKYPYLTKYFFAKKGYFVEVIKLYGSIEIAPSAGLADFIVDLVSTGETMRKNGLEEVETLMESTARLIANKALARAKHKRVKEILELLGIG